MAKELYASNLEKNGVIQVVNYLRNRFKKSDRRDILCNNCNWKHNHSHSYELLGGKIVELCVRCHKKRDYSHLNS